MFYKKTAEGIVLNVKILPNASQGAIRGTFVDAEGNEFLKISVISVPEKGKANKELINFLAKRLRVAKSNLAIISGETDRCKRILLENIDLEQIKQCFTQGEI